MIDHVHHGAGPASPVVPIPLLLHRHGQSILWGLVYRLPKDKLKMSRSWVSLGLVVACGLAEVSAFGVSGFSGLRVSGLRAAPQLARRCKVKAHFAHSPHHIEQFASHREVEEGLHGAPCLRILWSRAALLPL